jgi:hypothetical protein
MNIMYPPNRVNFFRMLYTRVRLEEWGKSWEVHHGAGRALILGIPDPTPPLRLIAEVFNQCKALVEFLFTISDYTQRVPYGITGKKKGKIEMPMGAGFPIFKMPHHVQREKFCALIH